MSVDAEAGPTRDGNRTEVSAAELQRDIPPGSISGIPNEHLVRRPGRKGSVPQAKIDERYLPGEREVYLHTVLSGDYPSSPEISAAVTETIEYLKRVPQANSADLSRSVVRSVVFGSVSVDA